MPSPKASSASYSVRAARVVTEGTIEKQSIALDARSIVALEFIQHWMQRHASVKAPPAVSAGVNPRLFAREDAVFCERRS